MSETVVVKWKEDKVPVVVLARLVGLAPITLRSLCSGPWDPAHISNNVVTSEKAFYTIQEKRRQAQLRIREQEKVIKFQFLQSPEPELVITDIPDEVLHMIVRSVSNAQ